MTLPAALVAHCRAGFEPEAAADLSRVAEKAGTVLAIDAPRNRGFVVALPRAFDAQRWPRALVLAPPIFVRSLFFGTGPHALLDTAVANGRPDRIAPLVDIVERFRTAFPLPGVAHTARGRAVFGDLRLETADTNEGKELSRLTRSLAARLAQALTASGAMAADAMAPRPMGAPHSHPMRTKDAPGLAREDGHHRASGPNLHMLFVDGAHVYVGASVPPWASPWPMGIPRLHLPRAAPSRAVLKLAEAIVTFLGDGEHDALRAGMRAADLGAAPGGWSWLLAARGLRVSAVDNARLQGAVASDPLVTHVRADGLTYRPRRSVDWLVCDIADQPSRIATVVATWMASGWARRAIFNLKLPMKKRYAEVQRCEEIIAARLARAEGRFDLRLRQLYHDREEITGYCARRD